MAMQQGMYSRAPKILVLARWHSDGETHLWASDAPFGERSYAQVTSVEGASRT